MALDHGRSVYVMLRADVTMLYEVLLMFLMHNKMGFYPRCRERVD